MLSIKLMTIILSNLILISFCRKIEHHVLMDHWPPCFQYCPFSTVKTWDEVITLRQSCWNGLIGCLEYGEVNGTVFFANENSDWSKTVFLLIFVAEEWFASNNELVLVQTQKRTDAFWGHLLELCTLRQVQGQTLNEAVPHCLLILRKTHITRFRLEIQLNRNLLTNSRFPTTSKGAHRLRMLRKNNLFNIILSFNIVLSFQMFEILKNLKFFWFSFLRSGQTEITPPILEFLQLILRDHREIVS